MPSHPSKRIKKAIASRPKPQNRKKPKLRKDPKGATGSMRRDRSSLLGQILEYSIDKVKVKKRKK